MGSRPAPPSHYGASVSMPPYPYLAPAPAPAGLATCMHESGQHYVEIFSTTLDQPVDRLNDQE